jgi:hypothetical protein
MFCCCNASAKGIRARMALAALLWTDSEQRWQQRKQFGRPVFVSNNCKPMRKDVVRTDPLLAALFHRRRCAPLDMSCGRIQEYGLADDLEWSDGLQREVVKSTNVAIVLDRTVCTVSPFFEEKDLYFSRLRCACYYYAVGCFILRDFLIVLLILWQFSWYGAPT